MNDWSTPLSRISKLFFFPLAAFVLVLTASLQARADTLVISGQFAFSPTAVDFSPSGGGNGTFTVPPGGQSTGIFVPLANTAGTVKDLNFTTTTQLNLPFLLNSFLTFAANPNLRLDLSFINSGTFSPANCGAVPAVGQTCTPQVAALVSPVNPFGLAPYNLTNTPGGGSTLQFTVAGIVVNGATTTPFTGVFSSQFVVPYQTLLAVWATGGVVTNTYSGSFMTTPNPVPEPATMLLLGTGLVGIAVKARKRRNTV